jgi:hypothetical protein
VSDKNHLVLKTPAQVTKVILNLIKKVNIELITYLMPLLLEPILAKFDSSPRHTVPIESQANLR